MLSFPLLCGVDNALGSCRTLPASWAKLPNLTNLDLSYNQLTGGVPDEFSAMSNLGSFVVNANCLGGQIPVEMLLIPSLQVS